MKGLVDRSLKVILCISLFVFFSGDYVSAQPPPPHPPGPAVAPPPGHVIKPHPPGPAVKPLRPKPYVRGLYKPPKGRVWIEITGVWTLVIAPPGDGPYIWVDNNWVPDPTPPPPDYEWVPGHWSSGVWIPGHWEIIVKAPGPDLVWIPGHWEGNLWIPGSWEGPPPPKKRWVPGYWGIGHRWIPGHWK